MLVLKRYAGEEIVLLDAEDRVIGRIVVLEWGTKQVKLGLECPDDVQIMRAELLTPSQRIA